ncbi:Uncharacterized protein TSPI_07707 [Trichinella spiralis]|uniref:Uncharacterized protein n=1 Tax=Trichinella spiralis TaxID=6334 RepID=A0ABR3KJ29_TRISP
MISKEGIHYCSDKADRNKQALTSSDLQIIFIETIRKALRWRGEYGEESVGGEENMERSVYGEESVGGEENMERRV